MTVVVSPSTITVAHVGDSRAMIVKNRQLELVTRDHTLDVTTEKSRVKSAGAAVHEGYVTVSEQVGQYVTRHHLMMTRALGDFAFKADFERDMDEQIVIASPDVVTLARSDEDNFLLLASDGLWTFMKTQEVVEFIVTRLLEQGKTAKECCMDLLDACAARKAVDNITLLLVPLNT